MAALTQKDLEILGSYATAGNRIGYWNYLASRSGNDNYGRLVKLSAYPFQKYGLVEGTVEQIGADSSTNDPQKQLTQQPQTYKAYIKLNEQQLKAPNGDQLKLTAGMSVVSEIHQGTRSVIEYLMSPVQKVTQEAARER